MISPPELAASVRGDPMEPRDSDIVHVRGVAARGPGGALPLASGPRDALPRSSTLRGAGDRSSALPANLPAPGRSSRDGRTGGGSMLGPDCP
jgi:hypothetical protein